LRPYEEQISILPRSIVGVGRSSEHQVIASVHAKEGSVPDKPEGTLLADMSRNASHSTSDNALHHFGLGRLKTVADSDKLECLQERNEVTCATTGFGPSISRKESAAAVMADQSCESAELSVCFGVYCLLELVSGTPLEATANREPVNYPMAIGAESR